MTALRSSAAFLVLAAPPLLVAAVTTDMLPTECGVVGRPIVAAWAIFSIVAGGLLVVGATTAGLLVADVERRRVLLVAATVEGAGWIAVVLFYLHQTSGPYPNCL